MGNIECREEIVLSLSFVYYDRSWARSYNNEFTIPVGLWKFRNRSIQKISVRIMPTILHSTIQDSKFGYGEVHSINCLKVEYPPL